MIPFLKMNGLGNDFLVVDARQGTVRPQPEVIRALADRKSGVGFDQFITIEPTKSGADAFMRIDNADGGEVEACGNATRCVGMLLMRETGRDSASMVTQAGLLVTRPAAEGADLRRHGRCRNSAGKTSRSPKSSATRARSNCRSGRSMRRSCIRPPSPISAIRTRSSGSTTSTPITSRASGRCLENHPIFPERANISLAHVTAPDAITLRTWERGVGITRACGTAACAALVCGARTKRTGRAATVTLPGGKLLIEWDSRDHIWMTGPAELEFSGTFDPDTGAFTRSPDEAERNPGLAPTAV